MATYLDRILEVHRARAASDRRPMAGLAEAAAAAPPTRSLSSALRSGEGVAVIAEVKRRSPSRGWMAREIDAGAVAAEFESGGARALSVLTDSEFFGGSPADVRSAREVSSIPILRKDFTISERDVFDARAMGADAVLLIVAALRPDELVTFLGRAGELGMDAVVEVHDEEELHTALGAGASVIGVNQRDLVTFEVDGDRAVRLASSIPASLVRVGESGVRDGADVARLAAAGYDAVLVGESLVTAADRGQAVRALVSAGSARPPAGHRSRQLAASRERRS